MRYIMAAYHLEYKCQGSGYIHILTKLNSVSNFLHNVNVSYCILKIFLDVFINLFDWFTRVNKEVGATMCQWHFKQANLYTDGEQKSYVNVLLFLPSRTQPTICIDHRLCLTRLKSESFQHWETKDNEHVPIPRVLALWNRILALEYFSRMRAQQTNIQFATSLWLCFGLGGGFWEDEIVIWV